MSVVEVVLPKMGLQMSPAIIVRWLVAEGDAVEEGDDLLEIDTDKVTAVVAAPASGIVGKLQVEPDDEVEVGALLATIEQGAG